MILVAWSVLKPTCQILAPSSVLALSMVSRPPSGPLLWAYLSCLYPRPTWPHHRPKPTPAPTPVLRTSRGPTEVSDAIPPLYSPSLGFPHAPKLVPPPPPGPKTNRRRQPHESAHLTARGRSLITGRGKGGGGGYKMRKSQV